MTSDKTFDDGAFARLVQRLAEAEAALSAAAPGLVDAIVDSAGQSYLLREAQQALLESEARSRERAAQLDAVLENAPDFLIYVGRDGVIRWANRRFLEFAGKSVVGAHWLSRSGPERRPGLESVFHQVVASGEAASHETASSSPDGRWYSIRFGPVLQDGATTGIVIIARDVTASKSAEAQLLISDRMASVGLLSAGVAHEINNPLAAVIANLDLASLDLRGLVEQSIVPKEIMEELSDARMAADRVRVIVRDLKVFSRSEESKREPVDVERVIDSTVRMAWNEIRHRARLEKEFTRVPPVEGNEARLGQVFLNLLVNAAQAISEGNAAGNVIRVTTSLASDRVAVTVSDTGMGIPEDVQRRLFTPFLTTKAPGSGTGLGLSICQRIISELGGEISFTSVVGRGTEFKVVLPVARFNLEKNGEAPSASFAPSAWRRGRVLVVDDDQVAGSAAMRILASQHEVVVLSSATAALERIANGERFDAILCDLTMPQMTGMDLFAELERLHPEQAAVMVFMTGGAFTPRAREFLERVRNHRLEKPFDMHELRAVIGSFVR